MSSKITPPGSPPSSPYLRPLPEPESPPPEYAREYTSSTYYDGLAILASTIKGLFEDCRKKKQVDEERRSSEGRSLLSSQRQ